MADKLWTLVQKLNERTIAGQVNWERTAEEGVYQASFPNYSVRLFTRERRGERDYIIQIVDQDGTVVEDSSDVDLARVSGLGLPDTFDFMRGLYNIARRKAMGVDQALDTLMEILDKGPGDDDVPF